MAYIPIFLTVSLDVYCPGNKILEIIAVALLQSVLQMCREAELAVDW